MPSRLASVKEAARNRLRTAIPWATILTYQPIEWDRYPVATIQWRSENILRVGPLHGRRAGGRSIRAPGRGRRPRRHQLDSSRHPPGRDTVRHAGEHRTGQRLGDRLEAVQQGDLPRRGDRLPLRTDQADDHHHPPDRRGPRPIERGAVRKLQGSR